MLGHRGVDMSGTLAPKEGEEAAVLLSKTKPVVGLGLK